MQRLDLIGQLVLLTGCFIFRDANGQALAYVYFEEEPGRRGAAKLLTRDEAQRIAANIAKLPKLLRPHREPVGRLLKTGTRCPSRFTLPLLFGPLHRRPPQPPAPHRRLRS